MCMKQDVLKLSGVCDSWQYEITQNRQFTERLQEASLSEAVAHGEHMTLEAVLGAGKDPNNEEPLPLIEAVLKEDLEVW